MSVIIKPFNAEVAERAEFGFVILHVLRALRV
jgi:hypothetical protein